MLVKIAIISPATTWIVDTYARMFHRAALIRKKVVLLLAILECSSPSHHYLDTPDSSRLPWLILKSVGIGVSCILAAVVATSVILPIALGARAMAALRRDAVDETALTWNE